MKWPNWPKSRRKQESPQAPKLPVVAVVLTSSCTMDDLEGVIHEMLPKALKCLALAPFFSHEDDILQTLTDAKAEMIIIVDTITDLEESCNLLNRIKASPRLCNLPTEVLTSYDPDEPQAQVAHVDDEDLEGMILQMVTKVH